MSTLIWGKPMTISKTAISSDKVIQQYSQNIKQQDKKEN